MFKYVSIVLNVPLFSGFLLEVVPEDRAARARRSRRGPNANCWTTAWRAPVGEVSGNANCAPRRLTRRQI